MQIGPRIAPSCTAEAGAIHSALWTVDVPYNTMSDKNIYDICNFNDVVRCNGYFERDQNEVRMAKS